ncbi:hypothetical protein POTOM_007539 [Populus tomentosa]|uniref:Uncharacterized protein n=1 Tax=Populus tomentosa TaxID=118781 RepID=A0A8X8AAV6_POPTO|nr:hypothetical protein POTOM_007539 [Populus tomentosa]
MRVHWKTHESASGETALTCEKEKEGKEQQMFLMQARDRAFPFRVFSRGSDEEYVKDTEDVINKYRREKALLGRASFRDMYSALNAVTGHYISFGPTAPIPSKRRARILEEMDTAEKALSRGR